MRRTSITKLVRYPNPPASGTISKNSIKLASKPIAHARPRPRAQTRLLVVVLFTVLGPSLWLS